ncbi:MAG: MtrB/PioB family decaheme-associated outer membrane protein [Zoogloeaceae bacterium]|jgi:MtrB/PioB family decaheme-associated outer membrane protein|nr:MtrB/PioB family decaheme-associated outer membrane protein [Zoogloeaceae bacterium]
MKTQSCDFTQASLTRAVRLALLAMFAAPGLAAAADEKMDEDVKALVCPTSYLEIGALHVSDDAPKFGEYNGLNDSGGYLVGNFGLSGGDGNCRSGGAFRWQVNGSNLGTTSRSLDASVAEQGKWNIGISFDQMRHYTTTGYQTPYRGSPGDNHFRLPPGYGAPANNAAPTAAQLATFRDVDVYNERKNYGLNGSYAFNEEWSVKAGFKRIDQSGAKLFNASSSPGRALLMNPTEYQTDMYNIALNYVGENAYASLEYRASLFKNDNRALWAAASDAAAPTVVASQMPDNDFHQVNFTGGYSFSPRTKLTGGFSYGWNTQTQNFSGSYSGALVLPRKDLDGDVRTTQADLRLTHQFTPALNLSTGYKYNERDNKTDAFLWGAGADATVNAPMSHKRNQFDAKLTYRIDKRQRADVSYDYEKIERWCNDSLYKRQTGQSYRGGGCAQVPESDEHKLSAGYKLAILDTVNFNASYTWADRDSDVDPLFWNPMHRTGANHLDAPGWVAFFQSSRRQDVYKTGVNWQVTPEIELGLNARHSRDDYYDADVVGVQKGRTTGVDLYANFNPSEEMSYGAWASYQKRDRDMRSSASNANLNQIWHNALDDKDNSFGLFGKQKLLDGKLVFSEDFSYSFNKTGYKTKLPYDPANANNGSLPDIKSRLTQFRLNATYHVDKTSSIGAGYLYQKLRSNDYYYDMYDAAPPILALPAYLQEPNYRVHAVYLTYRYSFQ